MPPCSRTCLHPPFLYHGAPLYADPHHKIDWISTWYIAQKCPVLCSYQTFIPSASQPLRRVHRYHSNAGYLQGCVLLIPPFFSLVCEHLSCTKGPGREHAFLLSKIAVVVLPCAKCHNLNDFQGNVSAVTLSFFEPFF